MNLLDSVLCTCKAQNYTAVFKQNRIDAFTLKLLNDDDLQLLGISEEDKRAAILQHVANLQIPAEKQIDITIDHKYIYFVLSQMSVHLNRHLATLSIASCRDDVVLCDVRLVLSTDCLLKCVKALSEQMDEFETKVMVKQKKRKNYKQVVAPVILVACLGVASLKLIQYLHN